MTYQLDELNDAAISSVLIVNSLNSNRKNSQDKTRHDAIVCCHMYTHLCVYMYIQEFD